MSTYFRRQIVVIFPRLSLTPKHSFSPFAFFCPVWLKRIVFPWHGTLLWWVRTTRGPSCRLVRMEDLESLGESNQEIMANNACNRGTRNALYDGDNEESTGSNHQLNPTAPPNPLLSNEAVSRKPSEPDASTIYLAGSHRKYPGCTCSSRNKP